MPGVAHADVDVEGDRQVHGGTHLPSDQRLEVRTLPRCHLEDELVVDLEQQP